VDIAACQGEASESVLLSVDIQDGLWERHRITCDDADTDVPGFRHVLEDPGPYRQLTDGAGVPLASAGGVHSRGGCLAPGRTTFAVSALQGRKLS